MKKGQKRKAPWLRALAIMLAMSMLMTSSGFQVLAQEASTEISAEQAAAEQARIAAEQAAAQAAAEAAAEQARIAAEQAAAEQARIAAEQAAKAQSEAESEAARIAAEQAAAAQAAAESEAARIAAEQAAAEQARIAAEQAAAESEAARIAAEQAAAAQAQAESQAASEAAAAQAQAESQAASEAAAAQSEADAAALAAAQAESQQASEEAAAQSEADAAALAAAQAESQQASEEAAAALEAQQAAAAQAAADAENARKQQEAAAQNKKQPSKEAKSEESEPIEGGKLVLKIAEKSTQEEGEYAKIKAEYGLGENSPIEEVETRLYIWSDTAELPQFDENNKYQDPASKRIFLLKEDAEGDRYVEYMLKAGESFKQEFLFADSSAEDGATVTFELSFGAEGEVPTDYEVPEKKSVVTYTLPEAEEEETEVSSETAVETEAPAETEAPVQTEAETLVTEAPVETEAPAATEAPVETEAPAATETEAVVVENVVTFEVAEGATVTVDGVDATNTTALAKDGTIYFTVTVLEGFELAEVLVDGSIPARATENAGEYIIENIKTDATVVAVTTAAAETETEVVTEVETEVVTEEATEVETEVVTEEVTEVETEVEYGTEFVYEDASVIIKATAAEEAKLPKTAILKAVRMGEETSYYNEAVAAVEEQVADADKEYAYVCWDVYFEVDGERVEPEAGLVSVTMSFKEAVFTEEEVTEEASVEVVHIDETTGVAETVTDDVALTGDGDVSEVGFTTDSFSPIVMMMELRSSGNATELYAADEDYVELGKYLTNADVYIEGEPYDPETTVQDNGIFRLHLEFAEQSNSNDIQFPLHGKLKYTLGKYTEYIKAFKDYVDLPLYKTGSETNQIGKFSVDTDEGIVYIDLFTDDGTGVNPITYTNYSAWLEFDAQFNAKEIDGQEEVIVDFGDKVSQTIKFEQGNPISGYKTASDYDPTTGKFTFVVKVVADRDADEIEFTDDLGTNLALDTNSIKFLKNTETVKKYITADEMNPIVLRSNYTKGETLIVPTATDKEIGISTATSNQFTGWINGMKAGEEYYIMYNAGFKEGAVESSDGLVQNLQNEVTFEVEDEFRFEASDTPEYSVNWVEKGVPEVENDKIKWTVVVNKGANHDPKGIIVTDTLSGGAVYDENTDITVIKKKAVLNNITGAFELQDADTDSLAWSGEGGVTLTKTEDGSSWTYTIPDEEEFYEYTFVYYTLYEIGDVEAVHANNVTAKTGNTTHSSGKDITIPGTGDGEGEGTGKSVFKTFVGQEVDEDANVRYAKWNSSFNVPVGGLENVVFTDTLSGGHKLPTQAVMEGDRFGLSVTIGKDAFELTETNWNRENDTKFTITFGNIANNTNDIIKVSITYYTVIDTNTSSNIHNIVKVSSDKVNQIASKEVEVKQYEIDKEKVGEVADDGTISWKIEIDKKKVGFSGDTIEVIDVVSANHTYVSGTAAVVGRSGKESTSVEISEPEVTEIKNDNGEVVQYQYKFVIPLVKNPFNSTENMDFTYVLTYNTKIVNYATLTGAITIENDVVVKTEGWDAGSDSVSFGVANKMISKAGILMPGTDHADSDNPNKATYQIEVNPEKVDVKGAKGEPIEKFIVTDVSSEAVQVDSTSVKVYQNNMETHYDNYSVNFTDGEGTKENTLVITIHNPGANTYYIQYEAYIRKPDKLPAEVEFYNDATLTADSVYYAETVTGEVVFSQEGSGGGTWSAIYVRLIKQDDKSHSALSDAEFELYKYTAGGWSANLFNKVVKTDSTGQIIIGQNSDGSNGNLDMENNLQKEVLYKIVETNAPDGYLESAATVYFVLDSTKVTKDTNGNVTGFASLELPSGVEFSDVARLAVGESGFFYVYNTKITDVEASKTWVDDNNRDNIRPTSLTVTLKIQNADGTLSDATLLPTSGLVINGNGQANATTEATLTGSGNVWNVKWTGLPELNAAGETIDYVIVETLPENSGYELTDGENTLALTNTHVPETVTKSVKKVWADSNNNDGKRPANIQLTLQYSTDGVNYSDIDQNWLDQYNNTSDKKIQYKTNSDSWKNLTASTAGTATVTVSGNITADEWICSWQNLPKYQKGGHGTEFTYRVKEEPLTTAADVTYTVSPSNGIVVLDNDDTTIKTITNSYETVNIKKKFVKIWDDSGNLFGTRPESIDVILTATVPGKSYTLPDEIEAKKTLTVNDVHPNKPNEWIVTWENLPKYYECVEIQYSIDEVNAGEGYVPAHLTTDGADGDYGLITLTNTLTNEKSVELEKIWSDGNNRDGKRPESIVIELTAKNSDDEAVEINGEFFTKYASSAVVTVNGVNSTYNNTNGNVTLTASDDNSWTMKWEHLPAKIGGKSITYSLDEVSVPSGYTKVGPTESNGKFTVTNYYAPKVEDVTVTKEWIGDNQNIDGNRPTSVNLKLMVQGKKADGTLVGTPSAVTAEFADIYKYTAPVSGANEVKAYVLIGNSTTKTAITSTGEITVSGNATADSWTCTWKNLPNKIFVNGEALEAVYAVVETSDSQFYRESVDGFTVKNTYEEILTDKEVTKKWEDSNNKFQNRPSEVTLQLYYKVGATNAVEVDEEFIKNYNTGRVSGEDIQVEVNGEKAATATGSVTISGDATAASWNCEWLNLPKYINGKEVVYSVRETSELTNNYTSSASSTNATFADDKATITNTYTEQKGKLKLTKNWADDNNHYGVRPNSITVKLSYKYAIDTEFNELDSDFVTTYLTNDDAIDTSSTVTLAEVSGQPGQYTLSVSDANVLGKWEAEWSNLPLEINKQNVIWKVEEVGNVDNYTITQPAVSAVLSLPSKEASAVITNTYDYDTVNIDITKVWADNGNAEGSRPKSVKVKLTAVVDGTSYPVTPNFGVKGHQVQIKFNNETTYSNYTSTNGEITINVPDDDEWNSSETWSCSVTNLPKKWLGKNVTYQIEEKEVPTGYTASPNVATDIPDNGTATITNTKGRETTEITIIKEWQDHNNVDGYRPDEITVELYADGLLKETKTINAAEHAVGDNVWSYTWRNLEKWRNNGKGERKAIEYLVKEVPRYENSELYNSGTAKVVKDEEGNVIEPLTYKIENSREQDKISVNGIKIWHDNGTRPESIVLELWKRSADEKKTETYIDKKTVSNKSNVWSCSWSGLEKNDEYGEITYFIKESAVKAGDLDNYYAIPNKEDEMVISNIVTGAEISKKAVTGEELEGAELQVIEKVITEENGEAIVKENVITSWTSDGEPHVIGPKVLYPGKQYTLREVSAPAGYHLAEDVEFTVNSDGSITKVEMKDEPTKVQFSKFAISGQAELPGANLQVIEKVITEENGEQTVTEKEIDSWTSGYTPHVIEGILEVGKTYYFRETLAPNGYAIAADVPFVVEGDRGVTQEVKMKDAVTSFTVEKLNGESFVEGAELVIWNNDADYAAYIAGTGTPTVATDYIGSNDVRWTSDGTAHTVSGLKPGNYVLHEISAPAGYTLAADILFELKADGTVTGFTNNTIQMQDAYTEFTVSKKAILGKNEVNLIGATLAIYIADENGKKTSDIAEAFKNNELTAKVDCEWTTDGTAVKWTGIPAGKYVLVEESAPAGYKLAADIAFEIHEDGSITCGQDTVTEITMMNERTELTVSKKAVAGTDELPGAGLAIYAVDAEGNRTLAQVYNVDATGVVVDVEDDGCSWTSDGTQKIWTGIPTGKYVLVEKFAPEGYTRALDIYFEIKEDGTVVSDYLEEGILTMRDELTEIKIHKLAADTAELLAGATLQVMDKTGTNVIKLNGVELKWESGADEHTITGLPVGEYILREIAAPAGYEVVQDVPFVITDDYKVDADVVEMTDTVVEFTVGKIDLYNDSEIPVAGATLQILNADGDVATTKYYVDMETTPNEYLEWTTGNTDKTIRGLAAGDYILRETAAPDGYVIAEDIAFTVKPNGDIVKPNASVPGNRLTMVDEPIKLEITKYGFDAEGTKVILPGASLEIREATGEDLSGIGDIVYNVYGDKMRFVSTETAVELRGIKPGTYWLVETDVPTGYTIAAPIQIVINEDMTVDQNPAETELQNYPTEIRIRKTDLTDGKDLNGVKLQILDKDGEVASTIYEETLEWTTDGTTKVIKGLPVGEYTLVEAEVPAGYTIADPITFRIDKDGNKVIVDKTTDKETDIKENITMVNDTVKVYIDKKETNTEAFVKGATFTLHEADETSDTGYKAEVATNVYDNAITFTTGAADVPYVFKTCADGSIELTGVKPGTYYLVEKVPFGYKKQEVPTVITVDPDQTVSSKPTEETVYNEPTLIEVLKVDAETGEALEGAMLGLYNVAQDPADGEYKIQTQAGMFNADSANENEIPVEPWTTSKEAKIFTGLKPGYYALVEQNAPSGYKLADSIIFRLNDDGTVAIYDASKEGDDKFTELLDNDGTATIQIVMEDAPVELTISKTDIDAAEEDETLGGAVFSVYEKADYDANGLAAAVVKNVYGDDLTFETIAGQDWTLTGIPAGTYYLVETTAPAGFIRPIDPVKVEFTVELNMLTNVEAIEIKNTSTYVEFSKTDILTGLPMAGAVLRIETVDAEGNPTGELAQNFYGETLEWTTEVDADGNEVVKVVRGLAAGTYALVEDTAPAGYTVAKSVIFTIDEDGSLITDGKEDDSVAEMPAPVDVIDTVPVNRIVMENTPATITVVKKDAEGKLEGSLAGATFEVRTVDELDDTMYTDTVAQNVYGDDLILTTTGDVTADILQGILPGTYYLVETKAPTGFTIAPAYKFTIEANQSVTAQQTLEVVDMPTEVSISKTDLMNSEELAGAEMKIVKVDAEGKATDELAESVYDDQAMNWISDGTNHVVKGLLVGTYALVETAAPAGYTIAETMIFNVNEDGTITDAAGELIENSTVVMENAPIRLEISKTGFTKDGKVVPLQGAKMEIHEKTADGGIGDIIYNVYGEKMRFESATEAVALDGVVPGTYWLVELEAPEGYMLAEPIEFTINEDMTVSQNPKELIMKDCPIEVEFSKVDITNEKELAGAKLQVMDKDGKEIVKTIYGEELVWTSTTTPKKFTGLPAGEYILRETAAPEGYAIAKDVAFTITSELTVLNKVVMKDEPTKVVISKKAITGVKELEGAQLQVLDTAGKVAKTIYGEELSWTSGQTPKEFLGLPTGTYTLHEVLPPEGYAYAQDVKFEVKDDGVAAKVEMKDDTTKVTISKMDVTNNKELAGAHLILKDAQGEIVAEWTSTGKPKEMNGKLIAGATYTLTEITAPVGYDIAKDITFTVNTDGTINKVVMDDKVADGKGSVTVQKLVMQDGKYLAVDYTFYTALFADEACTQRVTSVKPLIVNGSYTTSTIFTNLQYGTYYVAETDEFGNAISEAFMIESIDIIDGKAVLTPAQATAKSTIINHVSGFDEGYYKDGEIVVNKTVLVNGVETKVTDTFYFALFTDAALTMMYDTGVVELKLKDKAKGSITFEELPYGTYYLAETDKDGNPVDADYEYTAIISSSYCSLDAENRVAEREVINSKIDIPEYGSTTTTTTTTGTTTTTSVKTGDETPVAPYAAAMALSAAVLALLTALSKKRRKKS